MTLAAKQAAEEIAGALPFAQKYTHIWNHYCAWCRYVGEKPIICYDYKTPSGRARQLLIINGERISMRSVQAELKKILKK